LRFEVFAASAGRAVDLRNAARFTKLAVEDEICRLPHATLPNLSQRECQVRRQGASAFPIADVCRQKW
jgi:hypothetical protein